MIGNHPYTDRNKCIEGVKHAREVMGNKNITEKQYKGMQDALGFMYLYCPEDLKTLVHATLKESVMREKYLILLWAKQ